MDIDFRFVWKNEFRFVSRWNFICIFLSDMKMKFSDPLVLKLNLKAELIKNIGNHAYI